MLSRTLDKVILSCEGVIHQTKYQQLEAQYGKGYDRRLIDGRITGCGKCVGFCQYHNHSGFLTKEQRKEHDCLRKQCFYYVPKQGCENGTVITFASAYAMT